MDIAQPFWAPVSLLVHCEEIFPYISPEFSELQLVTVGSLLDYSEKNCQASSVPWSLECVNRILGLLAKAVLELVFMHVLVHKSYCRPDPSHSSAWDSPVPPTHFLSSSVCPGISCTTLLCTICICPWKTKAYIEWGALITAWFK